MINKRKLWLLFFITCFQVAPKAQETPFLIEQLNQEEYLPLKYTVRSFCTDELGYLWIGDSRGVKFYDGYDIHNMDFNTDNHLQLSNSNVQTVLWHPQFKNKLFIGTHGGLNIINLEKHENQVILNGNDTTHSKYTSDKGLITNIINTTGHKIWLIAGQVIGTLTKNGQIKWMHEQLINRASFLHAGQNKDFWAITKDQGIFHLKEDGTILQSFPAPYINNKGDSISLFFTTPTKDDLTDELFLYSTYPSRNNQFVTYNKITQDLEFSENHNQINKIKAILNKPLPSYHDPGLSTFTDGRVFTYYKDPNDLSWIGGELGIFKVIDIKNNQFSINKKLKKEWVKKIYETSNGMIFIGTLANPGLFSYNSKTEEIKAINGISEVTDITEWGKDTLLISTGEVKKLMSLYDLRTESFIKQWQPIKSDIIFDVKKDEEGTMWFNSYSNLFQLNPNTLEGVSTKAFCEKCSFEDGLVKLLTIDQQGKLWIYAHSDKELIQISKSKGIETSVSLNEFPWKPYKNLSITQLSKSREHYFWVGSNEGIFYYDFKNHKIEEHFTIADGLAGNDIKGILLEGDSIVWITTSTGLSRLDVRDEKFRNFYKKDGLTNNEFVDGALLKTQDGHLYLGTIAGLNRLNPKSQLSYPKKENKTLLPKIVKYNAKKGELETILLPLISQQKIILAPNEKYIEFYMANSDFSQPEKNIYNYQLVGFDENPILTNKHTVRYTNLNAGNYTFKVKSLDSYNNWSKNEIAIELMVEEVFYKKAWFIVVTFFGTMFLISGFYWYQINQREKIFKIRQKIADDLHDNVSNSLSYIRLVAKNTDKEKKQLSLEDTHQIIDISSKTLLNIRETIWLINPKNTSLNKLLIRMEELLSQLFDKGVNVSFKKIGFSQEKKIDFIYQRNVWLIFKEAVSNIVKHTNATEVSVILDNRHNKFNMVITNKYQTKHFAEYSTNKGLLSMERRSKELKGTIEIKETQGQFQLTLLVNKAL